MPEVSSSNMDGAQAIQPAIDTAAVRELLGAMKVTLGQLDQTFKTLNEQSAQVSALGPTMESASEQITALRKQVRAQEQKQQDRVDGIKVTIKDTLKIRAGDEMCEQIREQIRSEIVSQVKDQMSTQMAEHFPVPLDKQTEDGRRQLAEVKNALKNSEARRKNSVLRPNPKDLQDPLEVVLRPDGTQSKLYPANLRSLFAYDSVKAKELLQEFGLHDHGVLEKNLNRFMAHIGIRFDLVPYVPPTPTSAR